MPSLDSSAPGVYIQEISGGARPIQAVGTSTAGFIGTAPKNDAFVNEPRRINNFSEFRREFVGEDDVSTDLSHAVRGFFDNGGSTCYVCNINNGPLTAALDAFARIDDIAIVAAPGKTDAGDYAALLTHCSNLADRVALLDAPKKVEDVEVLTRVATASTPSSGPSTSDEDGETSPRRRTSQPAGARPPQDDKGMGAVYYPWIAVRDALRPGEIVEVPPSGHMAGIWARTDATYGVHKAPANEIISNALNVTHRLSNDEHGTLNANGVNAIRLYANEGIRVMGARTVAAATNEYRYLNVRRLVTMIEESISKSMRWVIFQPNDAPLWALIRRDVTAFLTRIWRDGALQGTTADAAFFVKCDAETNPQENIDAGIVTTVIGLAPVKPAEFVVFQIQQGTGGTEITDV